MFRGRLLRCGVIMYLPVIELRREDQNTAVVEKNMRCSMISYSLVKYI